MPRLEKFHKLPGVWQDGDFGKQVWSQIRKQIETSRDLNDSERLVLVDLLKRMGRPEARKGLGFRQRPRTAERNDKIANEYVYLRQIQKKSAEAAASALREKFPEVGARAIRAVIETKALLAPARARIKALQSSENTP